MVQRSARGGAASNLAPASVHQTLQSPGQPLARGIRASMETHFGHDFSQVRVHTDSQAARSTQAVNALAYTVGRHIAFDAGQYRPDTSAGRQLVAHELVHVMQQSTHRSTAGHELRIAGDDAAEHEAERMGAAIGSGVQPVPGESRPGPVLQRQPKIPAYIVPNECEKYGTCPTPPPSSPIPGCSSRTHESVMLELSRAYVLTQLDPSLTTGVRSIDCFAGIGPCTIEFDSGVAVETSLLLNPFVPSGTVGAGIFIVEEILPPSFSTAQKLKVLAHKRIGPKCSYNVGCPQPGQLSWTLIGCRQTGPLGPGDFPTPSRTEQVA